MEKVKSRPTNEWLATQKVLMTAIGFNEDDLEANRGGYMSKKQRAMLSRDRKDWLNWLSVIIVVVAGSFVFLLLNALRESPESFGNFVRMIGFLCLAGGLLSFVMWNKYFRLNDDLRKGDVFVAEGAATIYIAKSQDKYRDFDTYHVDIQDQRFTVDEAVYAGFKYGEPYAIYYTPFSKIILSAEWLHKREG
jgi:hypothetical protein